MHDEGAQRHSAIRSFTACHWRKSSSISLSMSSITHRWMLHQHISDDGLLELLLDPGAVDGSKVRPSRGSPWSQGARPTFHVGRFPFNH